jgi:hypothetical protein
MFANLTFARNLTIKKFILFILYIIIEGTLKLQISSEIVPDFATANIDCFKS